MRPPREDTKPWYKQFWPWFLISLPLSVVIAGIVTFNLAIDTQDGLVSDDYYKEGLAVNKDADSAAAAHRLGIAGQLDYNADTGSVTVRFQKPLPEVTGLLTLRVTHPTLTDRDQSIQLAPIDDRSQVGRIESLGPAHWRISISPADKAWRIDGRLLVPGSASSQLE
ncbi:MAG: FixH family protein [Gammaproteobacteria bacterium]|nr:FixH family protein [Gammaproteobacteria bacterium]MCP5299259.1 FixH family protein [Chromatiaceae bacterium]